MDLMFTSNYKESTFFFKFSGCYYFLIANGEANLFFSTYIVGFFACSGEGIAEDLHFMRLGFESKGEGIDPLFCEMK